MSLLGVWTKTPGRAAGRPPPPLAGRADRGRDNVPLLYPLTLVGRANHATGSLVGIDADDLDLAEVFRPGFHPVEVELVAGHQAIIRADRDLDRLVLSVDPGDFTTYGRRALGPFDPGDV